MADVSLPGGSVVVVIDLTCERVANALRRWRKFARSSAVYLPRGG
jgi:hypothetical protein